MLRVRREFSKRKEISRQATTAREIHLIVVFYLAPSSFMSHLVSYSSRFFPHFHENQMCIFATFWWYTAFIMFQSGINAKSMKSKRRKNRAKAEINKWKIFVNVRRRERERVSVIMEFSSKCAFLFGTYTHIHFTIFAHKTHIYHSLSSVARKKEREKKWI